MVLNKLVLPADPGGETQATFVLTQQQMAVLLNFAVAALLEQGLAEVREMTQEEFEQNKQVSILESIDAESMPKA